LLLIVGRLAPEKRWGLVIEAAVAAGGRRPIGLLLVGHGSERAALTRRIAGNPHIRISPPVDRDAMACLLASADVLVHGCEAETSGLIVAEARASGLPLVVPDEGGAPDQLSAGAGAIYRAANVHSLLHAIEAIVSDLPSVRRHAPDGSRQVATMDDHFHRLATLYKRLIRPLAKVA